MKRYLAAELDIAARTIWGEARGESQAGKEAVAHVMLNRWNADSGTFRRHDTLATVCLWNWQFSVWNAGDPNFNKMFDLHGDDPNLEACRRALSAAMVQPDPTEGAQHYHALGVAPDWAEGKAPVASIGGHVFYNDID